jgi:hypothetical protein
MSNKINGKARLALSVSATALGVLIAATAVVAPYPGFSDMAWAQDDHDHEDGGGGQGGGGQGGSSQGSGGQGSGGQGSGGQGSGGQGGGGHDGGDHGGDDGAEAEDEGGSGNGQGSPGGGAESGQGGDRGQGGGGNDSPGNFAGAELTSIGRMNIIKAPDTVLNHALYEVYLSGFDMTWYTYPASTVVANLTTLDPLLDSPTANMALLDSYWSDGVVDFAFTPRGDEGTGEVSGELVPNSASLSFTDFSAIAIGVAIGKDEIMLYERDVDGEPIRDASGDLVLTDNAQSIINALATIVWGMDTSEWDSRYNPLAIAEAAAEVQAKVIEVHDAE